MADTEDDNSESWPEECHHLLMGLKCTVERLLAVQTSNVWSTYGGFKRVSSHIEAILCHRIKVTQITSQSEGVFWSFVRGLKWLRPGMTSTMDRVSRSSSSAGQGGKGQLWLRESLQDHSLSSQLEILVSDPEHLHYHYQEGAFLRSEEYVTAMLICLRAVESNKVVNLADINPKLLQPHRPARVSDYNPTMSGANTSSSFDPHPPSHSAPDLDSSPSSTERQLSMDRYNTSSGSLASAVYTSMSTSPPQSSSPSAAMSPLPHITGFYDCVHPAPLMEVEYGSSPPFQMTSSTPYQSSVSDDLVPLDTCDRGDVKKAPLRKCKSESFPGELELEAKPVTSEVQKKIHIPVKESRKVVSGTWHGVRDQRRPSSETKSDAAAGTKGHKRSQSDMGVGTTPSSSQPAMHDVTFHSEEFASTVKPPLTEAGGQTNKRDQRGIVSLHRGDSLFQPPAKGQSLMSYLSEQDFNYCALLEKENAHFGISDVLISVFEQMKWETSLRKYSLAENVSEEEESDEEINELKQRIRIRRRERLVEKAKIFPANSDGMNGTNTTSSMFTASSPVSSHGFSSLSDSSEQSDDADDQIELTFSGTETSNLAKLRSSGLSLSMASLYSDAELKKSNQSVESRGVDRQRTFQMACPFHLKVRTTADGQMLVIKSVHLDHNHEVSQASYCHLPRQRQMDAAEKEQTLRFLRLKADKKFVQQHIREETGKVVTLKDLHNLIGPSRSGVGLNLQDVVSELEKTQGGAVIRVVETNGVLDAVFYQRHAWREIYQLFPEIVLIDATYKINNLGMPLYVMMVVDGNGESQVVAVWIVRREDKETMRTMVSIFKELNQTGGTRCFMADKDWTERGVIREEFPEAALLICLFHTMRTFRREVTEKSMGCTSGEKNSFLEILQKLVYSHSEEEYMENYQDLQATGNQKLLHYFDSNWHSIRKEWVEGMKVDAGHLLNRTNNRLESINQKIKSVVDQSGNLAVSVRELLLCFDSLDQERQHRATLVFQKVPIGVYAPETPVTEYQRLLTPHAFAFVQKQFELSCDIAIPADRVSSAAVMLQRSEGLLEISTQACTCGFFKAVSLPCRHIFAVRSAKHLSLFDGELCAKRWTKSYYRGRLVPRDTSESRVEVVNGPAVKAVPSQNQRYRTAFEVARRLASLASELPLREFRQAMLLIEQIATAWQGGKKVVVEVVDPLADSFGDADSGVAPIDPPSPFRDTLSSTYETFPTCFDVPGPPPGFTDNLPADSEEPGPPPGFTDNLPADSEESGPPPGFTNNLPADSEEPGPPPGFTDNLPADSEEPGPPPGFTDNLPADSEEPGPPPGFNDNLTADSEEPGPPPGFTNNLPADSEEPGPPPGFNDNLTADSESVEPGSSHLSAIKLPPKSIKRGRPKGTNTTVIGLPAKRQRGCKGPYSFLKLGLKERELMVLSWIFGDNIKALYSVGDIPASARDLPQQIIDENVDLDSFKKYFDRRAWVLFLSHVDSLRKDAEWLCCMCKEGLAQHTQALGCDSCLQWFHFKCVGVKIAPKSRYWFCSECKSKN